MKDRTQARLVGGAFSGNTIAVSRQTTRLVMRTEEDDTGEPRDVCYVPCKFGVYGRELWIPDGATEQQVITSLICLAFPS